MAKRFKLKPDQFKERQTKSKTYKDWTLEKNNDSNYDSERVRRQNPDLTTPTEEIHEVIENIRKRLKEQNKLKGDVTE